MKLCFYDTCGTKPLRNQHWQNINLFSNPFILCVTLVQTLQTLHWHLVYASYALALFTVRQGSQKGFHKKCYFMFSQKGQSPLSSCNCQWKLLENCDCTYLQWLFILVIKRSLAMMYICPYMFLWLPADPRHDSTVQCWTRSMHSECRLLFTAGTCLRQLGPEIYLI